MPYVKSYDLRRVLSIVREVQETATMENADFDESIKERTELWRSTWLIRPLDVAIGLLERVDKPTRICRFCGEQHILTRDKCFSCQNTWETK